MRYTDVRSRYAVLSAIAECDALGREMFRELYDFEESRSYYLRHNGNEYDSKPILAVAHKYQHPDEGPLKKTFSGGKDHAGRQLARLGFHVDGVRLNPNDWTVDEVRLVVDEYFKMFADIRAGTKVVKAARVRSITKELSRRSEGSVGRKQSNISAILERLDLPWIEGLAPLRNTQLLLEAMVIDWISDHPDFFSMAPKKAPPAPVGIDPEVPPPTHARLSQVKSERRASRVDFAARDARNRKLGRAGEKWAVGELKRRLVRAGRRDLAKRVKWVSEDEGDGLGYDIASFTTKGDPEFVEVKTTNSGIGASFLLTPTEIAASDAAPRFVLMRIFQFTRAPKYYLVRGSLKKTCQLEPELFRAVPRSS